MNILSHIITFHGGLRFMDSWPSGSSPLALRGGTHQCFGTCLVSRRRLDRAEHRAEGTSNAGLGSFANDHGKVVGVSRNQTGRWIQVFFFKAFQTYLGWWPLLTNIFGQIGATSATWFGGSSHGIGTTTTTTTTAMGVKLLWFRWQTNAPTGINTHTHTHMDMEADPGMLIQKWLDGSLAGQ